jgi:hypothetical protein
MQKLEIWIAELSWKFYCIKVDNVKLDHEDVINLFGGWNPAFCFEDEIAIYIQDNYTLFEDYEITYTYIDIE